MNVIKNIFNKIFWGRREKPEDFTITFIHRGALDNLKKISASSIKHVGSSWFTIQSGDEEQAQIPFHRIIEIRNIKTEKILYYNKRKLSK